MKVREFLNLVGIFEIDDNSPIAKEKGMYHLYIPVMNFIEVMEKNGLEVKKKKITAWGLATDLSKYSLGHLGIHEAYDIIVAWCREYGVRSDKFPPKKTYPKIDTINISAEDIIAKAIYPEELKPLCHPTPDCGSCTSNIDCGGQNERPKKVLENWETNTSKEELDTQEKYGLK